MLGGSAGSDICADCSAPGPQWAALNRGVVVCDDCCSIHRSLGRHISQMRSVNDMYWPPTLQEMFQTLVSKGANSIWEHSLKESRMGVRKPSPKDKIDRVKQKFIVQKYNKLAFMNRPPVKDSDVSAVADLSSQLHASVRGSNLETVLRFLAMGARPNFQHPERGNMALHVAASAGQQLQCELLVVYGANPCALDSRGHTPVECARIAGYHETADRLIECQYELTDRLASYVCGRRPVHISGEHHILPSLPGSTDVSPPAIEARQRLRNLSNSFFEELAADVYDEVDRRETEQVWLETHQSIVMGSGQVSVPFLPFNSSHSATRFQGRQKLATFNSRDFATLIIDILTDAKRRQMESMEKRDIGDVEGSLVPIDGLEVIHQQQLEEMREVQRQNEAAATAVASVTRMNQDTIDGGADGGATPMNAKSPPGSDLYDRVQHDYDEVSFESGKVKFASSEKRKDKSESPNAKPDSPDKPPIAPKPSMKISRAKDGEAQTPLSPLVESDGAPSPQLQRGSDDSGKDSSAEASAPLMDEKERRLKDAEFRVAQLLQLNTGMGEEIRLLQAMVQKLMQENSMLRTMQGRSSSMSGSSSPRIQDVYTTHQGMSSPSATSKYAMSAGQGTQAHKTMPRLTPSKSVPEPYTKSSSMSSEPPPIPEKKLPRRNMTSTSGNERSLSASAIVNSPTSPTSPANTGSVFHSLNASTTTPVTSSTAPSSSVTEQRATTDEAALRSPSSALTPGRGSPSAVVPRTGRGSPLAASRSSPISRSAQDKQRSSPQEKDRESPKDERRAVNGSPETAPKGPPKLPPKKRRAQSVYDYSGGTPPQQRSAGGGVANGNERRTSIHDRTAFDASTDDKTRIAATLGSANGLGRSSLIISPSGKPTGATGSNRSRDANRLANDGPGYSSGGSPALRRPKLSSTTGTSIDGSVDSAGGGVGRSKKSREQDNVVQQTEQITKRIQDLLRTAKSQELTKFISCSRKIAAAVNDMAALFPNRPASDSVRMSLASLVSSAARLKEECRVGNQLSFTIRRDTLGKIVPDDEEKVRTVTQQVIQCAYDIARAARELVQHVEDTLRGDATDSSN